MSGEADQGVRQIWAGNVTVDNISTSCFIHFTGILNISPELFKFLYT